MFKVHLAMYLWLCLGIEKKIKIGERLAKLQAKRLIALCTLFALQ